MKLNTRAVRFYAFIVYVVMLFCPVGNAAAETELSVKVSGDRVKLGGREVEVRSLLAELAKTVGFELELDPRLSGVVTIAFEGTVEECVRAILDGLGSKGYAMEFHKDPANSLVVRKVYVTVQSGGAPPIPPMSPVASAKGQPKRYEQVDAKYDALFRDFVQATGTQGIKDPGAVPDAVIASMIESERHQFRLIAAVLLESRTGKSPSVVKSGEDWGPSISELFDDLRILSAETPSYGYMNLYLSYIREFLAAIGAPTFPAAQVLLADTGQPPAFRSQLLKLVQKLDPGFASITAERLAGDANVDESLRDNAVRVLVSIGGEQTVERLVRLLSAPGSEDLRHVIRAQFEMLARGGDAKAAEALRKHKEDLK